MTQVIDLTGKTRDLRDCACGNEPEYRHANGLAHIIACPKCGAKTSMNICGIDAVEEWNGVIG